MTPLIPKKVGRVCVTKLGWLSQVVRWEGDRNDRSITLIKSDGSWEIVPGQEIYKDKEGDRVFTKNEKTRRATSDEKEDDILWDTDPGLPLKPSFTPPRRTRPVSAYEQMWRSKEEAWCRQGNFICAELTYLRRRIGRPPTTFYHAMVSPDFIKSVMAGKPCKYSIVIYDLSSVQWVAIKTPVAEPNVSMSLDGLTVLAYNREGYCVFDNPFV